MIVLLGYRYDMDANRMHQPARVGRRHSIVAPCVAENNRFRRVETTKDGPDIVSTRVPSFLPNFVFVLPSVKVPSSASPISDLVDLPAGRSALDDFKCDLPLYDAGVELVPVQIRNLLVVV